MAPTEHWLTPKDSAVKAEICPDGYSIFVHERSDRRGGGTGLLYRHKYDPCSLTLDSEWLAKASSYKLRVIVIYRPPYSDKHRVPIGVFLSEFPEYLETLLLCKELLLVRWPNTVSRWSAVL